MFKKCLGSVFIVFVLVGSVAAQKPINLNVTETMYDTDASGAQLLLRSDDYNGTGQATYASVITNGEWQGGAASPRAVWITPNAAIDNTQPAGPPAGFYSQNVTVRSQCFDQNGNTVPFTNVMTSSGLCKLGVNFTSGGNQYKLLMSPFPLSGSGDPPPTCPSTGCPAPGWATVTCNAVSNSQCVNWTIEPNTTIGNANVANLYKAVATSKHSSTWLYIGQYYNTYRINITNP